MSLRPVLTAFLLILSAAIAGRGQFRFDHWTTENGLPQNSVQTITQTPDGFIWFPTLDGLVRYDGVSFKIFNTATSPGITTNRLRVVTVDESGALWVAGERFGVLRYRDGVFRTLTTDDGLPTNEVYGVRGMKGGGVEIYTTKGVFRTFDDGKTYAYARGFDASRYASRLLASGNLWVIDGAGITLETLAGERRQYPLPEAVRTSDKAFFWAANFFEDPDGSPWLSFVDELYHLEADGRFVLRGRAPSAIRSGILDGRGNVWVGTLTNGVCRLLNGGGFDCYGTKRGLSTDTVYELFLDREKNVWITAENGGLSRMTPRVVEPFGVADGLAAANVYPILEDSRGDFWVGSYGGLTQRTRDGRVRVWTGPAGLDKALVASLYEARDGSIWVGAVGGIFRIRDGKTVPVEPSILAISDLTTVFAITEASDGAMWFATERGVYRSGEGGVVRRFTTADGLPADETQFMGRLRDGRITVGTARGAASFDGARFVPYAGGSAPSGMAVRETFEDGDGNLWFGTYDQGLILYRNGVFRRFTTADGLYSNGVFKILPDTRGNFWISSNQGIYRINRDEVLAVAEGRAAKFAATAFGVSDGMSTIECNGGRQPAGIRASDGRMWFPTANGVAIVDPEAVAFNPLPPPVVIDETLIEGKHAEPGPNGLVVEPGLGAVTIRYAGLSFIKSEQVKFRYMLEGLDHAWTDAGRTREATYPYLPPGNYRFHVIAANSDNVWNETGAFIDIEVRPPFYRRYWFLFLCAVMVALVVHLIYRSRISQLERERAARQEFSRQLIASQEQERKRIAAELHDSLGQRLVVIKNLALMFLRKGKSGDPRQIEAISTEVSEAIGEVSQISYNLRPYQLDRIGLSKAVEGIIESVRAASEIEFSCSVDNIDGYFPADAEISFFRIVQEVVANAVKHSGAGRAELKITRRDGRLELVFSDDGCGFPTHAPKSKSGGFGLLGIRERVSLLGGTVDFRSAPDAGTVVTVVFYKDED